VRCRRVEGCLGPRGGDVVFKFWVFKQAPTSSEVSSSSLLLSARPPPSARGLHSSTFQLNLSTSCVVDMVLSVAKTAQDELSSGQV
jgi:hypothetical protein